MKKAVGSCALMILSVLFFLSVWEASAETIVAERIQAANQLVALKKITVGPDDQYHGSVDPTGSKLVFTHKADLVAHLRIQDLKSGDVTDLLPITADSQEPSFSASGAVAFTYYRFSARGDICILKTVLDSAMIKALNEGSDPGGKRIHCLKRAADETDTERSNPFWVAENEVGFSVRNISGQNRRIVAENLLTGKRRVLAEGRVWSASMPAGGRFLAYSELVQEAEGLRRGITLKDLKTGQVYPLHFQLPGISGFPALSSDEKFLYFSHYLNDTNNDNMIDGSDNGVVFRVSLESALAAFKSPAQVGSSKSGSEVEIFPEQLTSLESSCSFPRPFQATVLVTCASGGTLDVYQIPDGGIVPQKWTTSILKNALQTARSYQDRVLILNTLRFRRGLGAELMDRELFSDYVLDDDTAAARYHLHRMRPANSQDDREFERVLGIYLDGRELKKSQPSEEISREFELKMAAILKNLNSERSPLKAKSAASTRSAEKLKTVVRGLLELFIGLRREAAQDLARVRFDAASSAIEYVLYFDLATALNSEATMEGLTKRIPVYRELIKAQELSEESKVYYTFELLKEIQKFEPDRTKRLALIERFNHDLPDCARELLVSEALSLKLIQTPDLKGKALVYSKIDQLMLKTKNDYFVRKAQYVRAIFNLLEAADFNYLSLVATNWLKYTTGQDTEFIFAREVFSSSALDQGYDSLGKKDALKASGFFFGSLSLTDDLESHNGYILSMILQDRRAELDVRYKNLAMRHFIGDNMKFVTALLLLIDHEAAEAKHQGAAQSDVTYLDRAIDQLLTMSQDHDSALRYLLLGYCYMQKLLRTADGLDLDSESFANAHRNLMLAYDQGRENLRVRAAALSDLGILHQRAQNHGLAVRFFTLRKGLGFNREEERVAFEALFARSLYFNHEPDLASLELAEVPGALQAPALLERRAYYLTFSDHFKEAIAIYERLFSASLIQGDLNLAKVGLSYAYALKSVRRFDEAKTRLKEAMDHIMKLKGLSQDQTRLVTFEPKRLQLIGYGLLGQMGSGEERLSALEKREALLESDGKGLLDQWLPTMIENRLWLASLLTLKDRGRAVSEMKKALLETKEFGDQGQYLGSAVFHSTVDYLAHGLRYPEFYKDMDAKTIGEVISKMRQAYAGQKVEQPVLDFQLIKIEILWAAYQSRVLKAGSALRASAQIRDLTQSAKAQNLKTSFAQMGLELEALAQGLSAL